MKSLSAIATIPGSNLDYAAAAEATAPDKQMNVQVQNYNYARLGR